jgi:NitT/TauT family transport system substrate-binding protein
MQLTPFAKAFIALVIVSVVAMVFYFRGHELRASLNAPADPDHLGASKGDEDLDAKGRRAKRKSPASGGASTAQGAGQRIVIGVNDFGGGYPLLLANDGALPGPGSLFAKAGLDVEVRLIRGSKERLKAFDDGEVQVMLLTLDYLANLAPIYKQKGIDLRSFLLVDWSRGNIGIAAKPQFKSIEELKSARIATTRNTPTHYFLLSLLEKSNLKQPEIDDIKSHLVWAVKTPDAGALFQRGEVDAVAIWEPHLSEAIADGKGVTLVSTETATNLVADLLFARREWLEENRDAVIKLVQVFFSAVGILEGDSAATVKLAASAFGQKPELVQATLSKIKPAQFADNRAFFGLETEDCAYDQLFVEASSVWQREGLIKEAVAPADSKWLKALSTLAPSYRDQKIVESFRFLGVPSEQSQSLLTKSVSIYFASGQSSVDPNARKVLDSFAQTLSVFQNAYVRVEGNTDNVGNRATNIALSKTRAEAVISYLIDRHRFERSRFVAIGNGPDQPVADNRSAEGRELNRRTDFKIIKNIAVTK